MIVVSWCPTSCSMLTNYAGLRRIHKLAPSFMAFSNLAAINTTLGRHGSQAYAAYRSLTCTWQNFNSDSVVLLLLPFVSSFQLQIGWSRDEIAEEFVDPRTWREIITLSDDWRRFTSSRTFGANFTNYRHACTVSCTAVVSYVGRCMEIVVL